MAKVKAKTKARGMRARDGHRKGLVARGVVKGRERAHDMVKGKGKGKGKRMDGNNGQTRKTNTSSKNENNHNNSATKSQSAPDSLNKVTKAIIPFQKRNRVLLVGEGDLSFALSLATHHLSSQDHSHPHSHPHPHHSSSLRLLATTLDSRAELLHKYPQAARNVELLERMRGIGASGESQQREELSISPSQGHGQGKSQDQGQGQGQGQGKVKVKVLYGVDATRLGKYKEVRKGFGRIRVRKNVGSNREVGLEMGGDAGSDGDEEEEEEEEEEETDGKWDRIVFNFPHVGGKSTDVNRQVRYNQELITSFLNASIPLLAPTGAILVTIFEGMPYTLWNIHDLARSVGLRVARSFRFVPEAYPGYQHSRTIGNILSKDGCSSSRGGWKGEERDSRMYAFVLQDGVDVIGCGPDGKKKKKKKKKKKHKRNRACESSSGESD